MTFTDIISPCQMRLWFGLPARSDTGLGKFVQDIVTILVTIITTLRISVTRIFSTGSGLGSWPWLSWWPEFLTPAVSLAEITQTLGGRPEKYLTSISKNISHYIHRGSPFMILPPKHPLILKMLMMSIHRFRSRLMRTVWKTFMWLRFLIGVWTFALLILFVFVSLNLFCRCWLRLSMTFITFMLLPIGTLSPGISWHLDELSLLPVHLPP